VRSERLCRDKRRRDGQHGAAPKTTRRQRTDGRRRTRDFYRAYYNGEPFDPKTNRPAGVVADRFILLLFFRPIKSDRLQSR